MEIHARKPRNRTPDPAELLARVVEDNPVYHPIYSLTLRHVEMLRGAEDPHDQIGEMLTVAYNYQLAAASYFAGRTIAMPLVFRVARGSLPRPEWVRDAVAEALLDPVIWAVESLRRSELPVPGLGHIPETLVVLHRNRPYVEASLSFAETLESRLSRLGTPVSRQRLPGPRSFSGNVLGRFYLLSSDYKLRDYREAVRALREMDLEPSKEEGGGLVVYVASRRIGMAVVTAVVDANNRASLFVMLDDRIRAIPMSDGVYDNLEIVKIGGTPPATYMVTVQQTGNRLFLNLTRALKMLGLGRGDTVRVRVETERRRIIIEPAVEVV